MIICVLSESSFASTVSSVGVGKNKTVGVKDTGFCNILGNCNVIPYVVGGVMGVVFGSIYVILYKE